jgi:hypothetical protein
VWRLAGAAAAALSRGMGMIVLLAFTVYRGLLMHTVSACYCRVGATRQGFGPWSVSTYSLKHNLQGTATMQTGSWNWTAKSPAE